MTWTLIRETVPPPRRRRCPELIFLNDTKKEGSWGNDLHGLLALVVLVLAAVIAHRATKALGLGKNTATA